MALANSHLKLDHAARRFVISMAIGTAFILTQVAIDYFNGGPVW